jgi:hypothetical protein
MADDKIAISYELNGIRTVINNLKEARQAQKDLYSEVIRGKDGAAKALADLKDQLEDITEETQTLKGSGVEKLTSSFSLLGQGFATLDTGKITTGFKGIGAAMSAIPIFLLIEGIKLLVDNFDEVIAFVGKFFGATNEAEKAVKKLTVSIDAESAAIANLIEVSDEYTKTALLQAKAIGASEEQLTEITRSGYNRKIAAAKEYLQAQTDNYNALLRNNSADAETIKKAGEAQLAAVAQVKKLNTELSNFNIQTQIDQNKVAADLNKERLAQYKEFLAKQKQANEAAGIDADAAAQRVQDAALSRLVKDNAEAEKRRQDKMTALLKDSQDQQKMEEDASASFLSLTDRTLKDKTDKEKAAAAEQAQAKMAIEKGSFDAAKGLSDLYFGQQLKKSKGNAAEELKIRKQMFNVDKAFSVARAVIDGVRSVQAALTLPPPAGPILAAVNAVLAVANVANIARTQFNPGSGDSAGTDIGGGASAAITAPPPSPPILTPPGSGQNTTQINNGGAYNGRIYVVESDITDNQNQVGKLVTQSQFP